MFRQESGSSEAEREGKKVLEVMPCPALGRGGSGSSGGKLGGPPFICKESLPFPLCTVSTTRWGFGTAFWRSDQQGDGGVGGSSLHAQLRVTLFQEICLLEIRV